MVGELCCFELVSRLEGKMEEKLHFHLEIEIGDRYE